MTLQSLSPLLALNLLTYVPWTALFLITQLFGIRLYYLKRREECIRIQKRIQGRCSHTADGEKGYGYSFGLWYILSMSITNSDTGDNYTVYMIATRASYEELTRAAKEDFIEHVEEKSDPSKSITVWQRTGSFFNTWYRRREMELGDVPRPQQKEIIDAIMAHQKKERRTVAYINGPPGTGKSMIGLLLAKEYGCAICNTLKLWQPGDSLGGLYLEVEPTQSKPLVVIFDEIDEALIKIHSGIEPHKNLPIETGDKAGWNHTLDEIQRKMYPNLIVIMTSNRGPDFIRKLDPSYIREGRVNLFFELL